MKCGRMDSGLLQDECCRHGRAEYADGVGQARLHCGLDDHKEGTDEQNLHGSTPLPVLHRRNHMRPPFRSDMEDTFLNG